MLDACVRACPDERWDLPVAKYPFWLVAYHTMYCTDWYLARREEEWTTHPRFHPAGRADLEGEYPSRRMTREDLSDYAAFLLAQARASLGAETGQSLAGPSGFSRLAFSRAELHMYNLRHIQHHTGQLGAFLRVHGVQTNWVKAGWGTR